VVCSIGRFNLIAMEETDMRSGVAVLRAIVLVVTSVLLGAGAAYGADVHVMISGGFSAAYGDLAPAFEKATGHKLVTVRGASMGTTPSGRRPGARGAAPNSWVKSG
jgi:hypothetical protein